MGNRTVPLCFEGAEPGCDTAAVRGKAAIDVDGFHGFMSALVSIIPPHGYRR
jgi:hypothetical protein